ncbi:MAG: NAD-dependent epimerase/dehydratase family protein [Stenotrophobium sp.]
MAKTAFVTGATGFVGINLIEQLLDQGWEVTAMHRQHSDIRLIEHLPVRRVIGDVTHAQSLKNLIRPRVSCVFHVAGNTSLWSKSHAEQIKVNVKGTRNVVRAALDAGARRFVHTSSIVAYGLHGGTVTEDTPTRGNAAKLNYIRSKALAEREVRRGLMRGLPAVILNPSNIIGAYDSGNWSRMFRLVQAGRLPVVPPGGGSFCHAREVARMHIVAAERGRVGANYLLGSAESSYLGLAREISHIMGLNRRIMALPPSVLGVYARVEEWLAPLFGREPDVTRDAVELLSQNIYCNAQRAKDELGYRPQSLQTMLQDCHDWMLKQGLLKPAKTR